MTRAELARRLRQVVADCQDDLPAAALLIGYVITAILMDRESILIAQIRTQIERRRIE